MLKNADITYYHKTLNENRLEVWQKHLFQNVWKFGGIASNQEKGYTKTKEVDVRIPIELVSNESLFQLGDIIAIGTNNDITTQDDLDGIEYYNVTSIKINNFGTQPHIHLGGK